MTYRLPIERDAKPIVKQPTYTERRQALLREGYDERQIYLMLRPPLFDQL